MFLSWGYLTGLLAKLGLCSRQANTWVGRLPQYEVRSVIAKVGRDFALFKTLPLRRRSMWTAWWLDGRPRALTRTSRLAMLAPPCTTEPG